MVHKSLHASLIGFVYTICQSMGQELLDGQSLEHNLWLFECDHVVGFQRLLWL